MGNGAQQLAVGVQGEIGRRWLYCPGGEGEQVLAGRRMCYGQPNLVVKKDIDITVMDVKTGTPRQWDIIQVMLYMFGLDRYVTAWGHITLKGRVVYSDHGTFLPMP
jgi:hypothetical protein